MLLKKLVISLKQGIIMVRWFMGSIATTEEKLVTQKIMKKESAPVQKVIIIKKAAG